MKFTILLLLSVFITLCQAGTYYYHYCTSSKGGYSEFPTYCCGKYMHEKHYGSYFKNNPNKCYFHNSGAFPNKYYSTQHHAWRLTNDPRLVNYFGKCCQRHGKKYGVFKNAKKGSVYSTIKKWNDLVINDATAAVTIYTTGFKP